MSSAGISDDYDNVSDQFEDLLREKRQKTRVIWQSAFSQVALQRRKRTTSYPEDVNIKDQDNFLHNMSEDPNLVNSGLNEFGDDRVRIKNLYDRAKNEYKVKHDQHHNFGEFNSSTRNRDINENKNGNKKDDRDFESFNMTIGMDNDKSSSNAMNTRL